MEQCHGKKGAIASGHRQHTEAGKGKGGFCPYASRRTSPADSLMDFRPLTSVTVDNACTKFVVTCYSGNRKLITGSVYSMHVLVILMYV